MIKKTVSFLFICLFALHLFAQNTPTELWVSVEFVENASGKGPSIKLDGLGNVYMITTQNDINPSGGYTLVKYDTLGDQIWQQHYPPGLSGHNYGDMLTDSLGHTYVAVRFYNLPYLDVDAKMVKYSPTGEVLWENGNYRDGQTGDNHIFYLQMDSVGNLYSLGRNDSEEEVTDNFLFVSQIDTATGLEIWRSTFPGSYLAQSIRVWADRIIAVGSRYSDGVQYYDIIQVDKQGNLLDFHSKPYIGYSIDFNLISSSGDLITGNRGFGYNTTKISVTGDTLWRYALPQGISGDKVVGITEDNFSNIYVTGSWIDSNFNRDILTTKFSKDGELLWQSKYDYQAAGRSDGAFDICVDDNFAYVTGFSTLNEDGNTITSIVIYDKEDGEEEYTINLERGLTYSGRKILAYENKFCFSNLSHMDTVNTTEIITGCFRMPEIVSTLDQYESMQQVSIFPNPFSQEVHLSNLDLQLFKTVDIFDMQGKLLLSKILTGEQENLMLNEINGLGTLVLVLSGKSISLTKTIVRQ